MANDQKQSGQTGNGAPAPAPAPAAPTAPQPPASVEAPAPAPAPVFLPKVGDSVMYTETIAQGPQKGVTKTNLFIVTEVGQTTGPKKDEKGAIVTEKATVKYGDGTKEIVRAVMETVPVFGGVIMSAQMQFPTPKRGVLLGDLSALEA